MKTTRVNKNIKALNRVTTILNSSCISTKLKLSNILFRSTPCNTKYKMNTNKLKTGERRVCGQARAQAVHADNLVTTEAEKHTNKQTKIDINAHIFHLLIKNSFPALCPNKAKK